MSESGCFEFEWDAGNQNKSRIKHGIHFTEAEEAFVNIPLIVLDDVKHSDAEQRYIALGKTNEGKRIFISFTYRNTKIRVISARNMNKKERGFYEKEEA
jgi:uncharacterized DUF497 family protein